MAWGAAPVQKATNSSLGNLAINVTFAGTTAGNFIGVLISVNAGGALTLTVSDTPNGSYTSSFNRVHVDGNIRSACFYIRNNVGGDLTINCNGGGVFNADWFVSVCEFAGGDTTAPASGTPATNEGNSTTANTTAMTPADNDVLLFATTCSSVAGTVTQNAGAEGFTLLHEQESGAVGAIGSAVFKVISGAPGTPAETWTVPSGTWTAGIAAFKPAAAAVAVAHNILLARFP